MELKMGFSLQDLVQLAMSILITEYFLMLFYHFVHLNCLLWARGHN